MFIIDIVSFTNLDSTYLLDKLKLKNTLHPIPYKITWMNEGGACNVIRQVLINFKMDRYKDQVKATMVLIQACHVLLGRPWEYDLRANLE